MRTEHNHQIIEPSAMRVSVPHLRRVEVLLAGAFLAICVQPTLSDLSLEASGSSSAIALAPKVAVSDVAIQKAAATREDMTHLAMQTDTIEKSDPAVAAIGEASWNAKVRELAAFEDLLTLPIGVQERELLGRMLADEFEQGKPFQALASLIPMAQILRRGVSHIERQVFRSPAFLKTFGYDMVRYTVDHPDQSQSVILAYRERTARGQASIGGPDTRPVFSLFAVAATPEMSEVTILRDGQLNQHAVLPREEALAAALRPTLEATPLLSSR